jgi:hypothetical protein
MIEFPLKSEKDRERYLSEKLLITWHCGIKTKSHAPSMGGGILKIGLYFE